MSCKKCKCKVCSCIKNDIPKIAVNEIVQNPNENDVVNIKVPTKTSQLINDSGFGQGNGGQKIEDIRVNGELVPIINKEAIMNVPTKTSNLINDSNFVSKPYVDTHIVNKANPHNVTKEQVGLENVDNTSDLNKPISTATQNALNTKISGVKVNGEYVVIEDSIAEISVPTKTSDLENNSDFVSKPYVDTHIDSKNNPHNVTKLQVGLGNVDNTSDLNKPISTATQDALNNKLNVSDVKSEIVYQDLKPVNSVAIESHSVKKINTIADLRNNSGEYEGQIISLLGYYEAGDKEPLNYKWTSEQGVDDGGSVVNTESGSWLAVFSDGVDCLDFGAKRSDSLPKNDVINIFRNWTNYVNSTNGKMFKPTELTSSIYFLYEPLYIRKSFVGNGVPAFMYLSSEVGKVVSATEKTVGDFFDFNVSAVMGINPVDYQDAGQRLEFKNFRVLCTNGDDDTTPAQDYGVYFPQGTSFEMSNIIAVRPQKAGFYFRENWMSKITLLNTWESRKDGFRMMGTFTSLDFSCCYAHGFNGKGFEVNGAVYSNFSSLGADSGFGSASYSFASCKGTNLSGLGSEVCRVNSLIEIGDFQGSVNGVYFERCEFVTSVFDVFEDSVLSISGIKSVLNTRKSGSSPSSFRFQSSFGGVNNIVTINNDTDFIKLTDFNAYPDYLTDKGKYIYNIRNAPYSIFNNKEIKNSFFNFGETRPVAPVENGFQFFNSSTHTWETYFSGFWYDINGNVI